VVVLRYDRGTVLVWGDVRVPYSSWDPRVGAFRAMAIYYREIRDFLDRSSVGFEDHVLDPPPCPELRCGVSLRDYQREAVEAWMRAGRRGTVVLPTGAGKTVVALGAIAELNAPAVVLVPTLDLMDQWRTRLREEFGVEVGAYGGGENRLEALTVSTYDSAYLRAEELGNRFMLAVFDEVHHLPAQSYRQIAEMFAAPYRMGLTATYEREDGGHEELPRLVGGKVYELEVDALAGTHLAHYTLRRLFVDLTPREQEEYDENYGQFKKYLVSRGLSLRGPEDFQRFVMRTGQDPAAREALLARNRALEVALNSSSKMEALRELLVENPGEKALIFTRHNRLVYEISRRFLLPAVTHQTPKEERAEILDRFRSGEYRRIVTSQVLDEGIDVPDATMAVILSGTGSSREFIQRLGRVLRKREGKRARLVEIVSRETAEAGMSQRRREGRSRDAA